MWSRSVSWWYCLTEPVVEEVPAAAEAVFGSRLPLAVRYVELLAGPGVTRGLIGPREAGRLWSRHVLNCAVLAPLLPPACSVVDVGSGAGLPGIVLALVRADLRVTLVEPMQRRVVFLEESVTALGLAAAVSVRRARVEELHGDLVGEVVTARALAPLGRLVEQCWPLVRAGGLLMAVKGATAQAELVRARAALPVDAAVSIQTCGGGIVEPPATVVLLRRFTSEPGKSR